MKARWVGVFVGGAAVGMMAVAAAAFVGRDDQQTSIASPRTVPGGGDTTVPGVDAPVRSITVNGQGKIKVKPDTASLNVGVQATAATASEALAQANTSAAALIAAVKGAGVSADDIVTSGLSVYPQYSSANKINGYQASNSVTVTVRDIDNAGAVIDVAAAAAGDNITIGGISFYVDETEALIGAARADAIDNANKRATQYADAAGVTVGQVLQISEISVSNPIPLFYGAADASRSLASATPIETGTQDMTVSVTVVYALS
jgi:uncharacterized protein YggE